MKWLSLFTGIGGFDLALKRAGQEIIGACEIDEYARRVYARHFPKVPIHRNATELDPRELPDFDGIVAGFPCQAFSVAGKRLGFEESRGTLFFEIARIAKQKRPRYLLLENVKGLINHDGGKTFANILATLDELGYDAQWQVLNSKYFVPQNRERIFIVGYLRGTGRPQVFPVSGNDKEDAGESRLDTVKGSDRDSYRIYGTEGPSRTLRAHPGGMGKMTGVYAVTKDHNKLRDLGNVANCIDSNYFKGQDNHGQRTLVAKDHPKHEQFTKHNGSRFYDVEHPGPTVMADNGTGSRIKIEVKPVLTPDRPVKRQNGRRVKDDGEESFTLTAQDKHGVMFEGVEKTVRRLTPKECERLQGFPDDYTKYGVEGDEISDTQRYKMCGNAVTVNVIEFILRKLL